MRVPEATCTGNAATGDRFGSSKLQIINHKALETLAMARSRRPYTKLTYSFSYYRSKGTSLPPETRYRTQTRDPSFARQTEWKKHKLCLLSIHPHIVATERNDEAYSLLTTMEAPATWTLVLFQQAIDRQDRTTD